MINRLLTGRGPAPSWVSVDAGHDCGVTASGTALTVDTLVGGVHFDAATPPEDLGYKAVAVSVSDLVAARARPEWLLLSLS
ncbi:MAG: AIR synthase related protein, partial [Myxococcota bacterium]